MTGTLSQIITLVSYGNQFLSKGCVPDNFYPGHDAFVFCNRVNFVRFKKSLFSSAKEVEAAETPNAWFGLLKDEKCTRLRVFYQPENHALAPDHKLAGFVGGGGSWYIEAVYPRYSDYWSNRWVVTDEKAPDRRIWSVSYGQTASKLQSFNTSVFLLSARNALQEALDNLVLFCSEQRLSLWTEVFDEARKLLNSPQPEAGYAQDWLAPDSHTLAARQLLFASRRSSVFGGMGSWNDQSFDDKNTEARYEKLSTQLYNAINGTVVAAMNSDQPKI